MRGAEAENTTVESSGDVESKETIGGNCESLLVARARLEFIVLKRGDFPLGPCETFCNWQANDHVYRLRRSNRNVSKRYGI